MDRRKRSAALIVDRLTQADDMSRRGWRIDEICRSIGISDSTYFNWRRAFGGMGIDQVERQQSLETENARLKRTAAKLTRRLGILREAASGNF